MRIKLLYTIAFLFTINNYAQSNCNIILNETFNENGTLSSEWVEYGSSNQVSIVDQKLQLDLTTTPPNIYHEFSPISSDHSSFSFDVSSTRNWVDCRMNLVSNSGKIILSLGIGMLGAKNILYATSINIDGPSDFTGTLIPSNYASNTTYSISVNLDFEQYQMDIYNAGVLMAGNIPFLETAEDVAKIDIQLISMYNNEGRFHFDNLLLSNDDKNKLVLQNKVTLMETTITSVYVGDKYGQYTQTAIDDLQTNIDDANIVLNNCDATPSEITTTLSNFETAITQFESAAINDPVLKIYSDNDLSGEKHEVYCGYYNGNLGNYDNWGTSFTLEQGYMATFAQEINGLGTSKVYIAQDKDISINLPTELQNTISFIRVSPWFNTRKKGGVGKGQHIIDSLNVSWYYNWGSTGENSPNREFVPMTWSGTPPLSKVEELGSNMNFNHYLACNEPDGPDQANMTVDEALIAYKNMLASGLRLGAPAVTHEGRGTIWLDEFMERCKELNYRVDFVPIHHYVRRSSSAFKEWYEVRHEKYQVPLWITEYNYGNANISTVITDEVALQQLTLINNTLEATSYVERYSPFYFQPNQGQLTFFTQNTPLILNDTGKYYRDLDQGDIAYTQEEYEQIELNFDDFNLQNNIWIYPNPVSGSVIIINDRESILAQDTIVKIYGINGKKVASSKLQKQIDISNLQNGIYLIQLYSSKVNVIKKIIINR